MEIENLFNLNTIVKGDSVIYKFTYTDVDITNLRMLKTIQGMEQVFKSIDEKKIKRVYFIFVADKISIPANFNCFKDFAKCFHPHCEILKKKLDFTIIQSNNKLFNIFFNILKQNYTPVRPLYLSLNENETKKCLKDKTFRDKLTNISKMVAES